jgi:signal transduction histidine kinase/CheY-like chemotaxis protein
MLRSIQSSIRAKVMLAVLATSFVALLITGTLLVVYDLRTHRANWVNDMLTQAEIVSRASAPALAFQDSVAAHQNLALLSVRPQIMAAALYAAHGGRFATYARDAANPEPFPVALGEDGYRIGGGRLELTLPVSDADERLGTIYLVARYDLVGRLLDYLAIVGIILVASLLVALLMSYRLQEAVTRPILAIAEVARAVKQNRDFSLRARKTTEDETGHLVTAFNDMLTEVGERTRALEESNRALGREMEVRQEAENALREAGRRKDEFLATLAHELRNPLSPIRNAVEILRRRHPAGDEERRAQGIIDRQVQHMVRLIDDLLDISRITRDSLELRISTFDLAELFRDVIESCEHALAEAGHAFEARGVDQPIALVADRARLAQAITNVVNNAIKYTPAGGRITLEVERLGKDLLITVTDTGIGIPPDKLTDIFHPFSQLDRSLEKTRGGLGIGLALSQRLIALHGGTLTASSRGIGTGSQFRICLPVVSDRPAPAAPPETPLPAIERLRVLVADDNRDAAESLGLLLQVHGFETETAVDGEQALALATAGRFDAAILDIGMPHLNGYDVARGIRALPKGRTMLLVALTGWGQREDKERALAAGFDDHLTKPVHPHQLLGVLARVRSPA